MKVEVSTSDSVSVSGKSPSRQWWLAAVSSAVVITSLVAAVIYLVTKKPSTVDNLVILTVPSGAEIKLDSRSYGNSPIKLERLKVGTYTLTISKEGYEPITEQIEVKESMPLEFKLKLLTPPEAADLNLEEQIALYQQKASEAFAQNHFLFPLESSALHYVELIRQNDETNQFANDMRENIRKRLLQIAQSNINAGNFGAAKEIYANLLDFYPKDTDVRVAAGRLDSQLSTKRGELRDYIRKAREALNADVLLEPNKSSAYFYIQQALAIESQNPEALAVQNEIKSRVLNAAEQAEARNDFDLAIKYLDQGLDKFPQDRRFQTQLQDAHYRRNIENAKNDPKQRRIQGLEKSQKEDFAGAVRDLDIAFIGGQTSPDVIFALGRAHFKLGHLDAAANYLRQVPKSADEQYRSAIAMLGDVAGQRGDKRAALEKYKEARALGGSILYTPAILDDKVEKIEKEFREKAAEPVPVSIQVKHPHGALRGSCSGTLSVDSAGVRYNSSEHPLSLNLVGISVRVKKDEMTLGFQGKTETFKVAFAEADRFREALMKYQAAAQK